MLAPLASHPKALPDSTPCLTKCLTFGHLVGAESVGPSLMRKELLIFFTPVANGSSHDPQEHSKTACYCCFNTTCRHTIDCF